MSEREPLMNDKQLYFTELNSYPPLTREEERALEVKARAGDKQARERLVIEALHYVSRAATRYKHLYALEHDDYLDIVQVGNLAIVEKMDRAFATSEHPVPYLYTVARHKIVDYCEFHSSLFSFPINRALLPSVPKAVELEPSIVSQVSDTEHSAEWRTLQGQLHEAIATMLTDLQRDTIESRLGLNDRAPETFEEIERRQGRPYKAARSDWEGVVKKLRKHFKQA